MKIFRRSRSKQKLLSLSLIVQAISVILILIGVLTYTEMGFNSAASAQSTTRLNAEISSLRGRINRLEAEIRRLNRLIPQTNLSRPNQSATPPPRNPTSGEQPPTVVDGELVGRSDPTVEKLSTLLIELKEDVRNLDRRLTDVEAKVE